MTRCSNRLALLLCAAMAMAPAMGGELRGSWQSYWLARSAAQAGPLAQAHALLPAIAAAPASSGVTLAQVQGSAVWGGLQWHADVVAQAERPEGGPGHSQATVMEGYAAGTLGSWQWSLGRKVVGWDVGYGFRPNDVVQQEVRRLLVAVPLQGRPVLMAERYTPDAAWSLVAVNPTTERSATGAREPALAARWYQRLGAADAYAFARWGQRTRGSLGAAFAWVVSDALELHGSLRHMAHFDTWEDTSAAPAALALASPWRTTTAGAAQQALLGGTWTNAQQVSVLLEAWYDGTAPSAGQWRQWAQRGEALQRMAAAGAPPAAVAGNLAWQAQAFNAFASLRRQNLLLRGSWTAGAWEPALDMLYHPEDGGALLTASLAWKGDRWRWEGGLRASAGPAAAVVRQLPVQRQAYVQAVWSF